LLVRVASQVPQFAIPVLDLAVVVGDVGVTSVVVAGIDVVGKVRGVGVVGTVTGIGAVGMVPGFRVVRVVIGIGVGGVGNVVVVVMTVDEGSRGVAFAGALFVREISPLGVCSCATTRWMMVLPVRAV
jgi:hypothetical protein